MESPNDGIPSVVEAAVDWMVVCTHFTARIRYCLLFPSLHFNSFIFLKCARLCMSLLYVLPCERLPSGIETCFKYEVIVIQRNATVVRIVHGAARSSSSCLSSGTHTCLEFHKPQ